MQDIDYFNNPYPVSTKHSIKIDWQSSNMRSILIRQSYTELILALGAEPLKPPIPGIDRPGLFNLRNLQDMDKISTWIEEKEVQHCVVAGAGFVGLEMVEQLVRKNIKVTLVELAPQVLGPLDPEMAAILHRECEKMG